MNPISTDINQLHAQQSYLDLNQLQSLKQTGREDQDAALKQIAKQFEALFMQMMMKSMRSANEVFEEGNLFNSSEMKFHRDMLDNQLSLYLSGGKGSGLADVLYRQLKQGYQRSDLIPNPDTGVIERGPETTQAIYQIPNPSQRLKEQALFDGVENPADFVEQLTPYAQKTAASMGVDYRVLIAQSALETGWGKHLIKDSNGHNSLNFFNIKATGGWSGDSARVSTLEYRNGVAEREYASFRKYATVADSFADYQKLLQQPRYAKAMAVADDAEQFVKELQKAGYATDPNYADKILGIMNHDAVIKTGERIP